MASHHEAGGFSEAIDPKGRESEGKLGEAMF
jgi:hypothetical protein